MTTIAAVLIISSAFFHAAWNYLGKRQNPSVAFFFIASAAAALILSPLFLIYRHALPGIPATVWLLILATGAAQDEALRQLRQSQTIGLSNTQITLLFIALQACSTALMLGLATGLQPAQRRQLDRFLKQRPLLISATATGLVIVGTYGLVLAAMAYVTNVSYVAAFRQLSIPIGAFLGITLQGEPRQKPKLIGIGIVVAGLILVGFG